MDNCPGGDHEKPDDHLCCDECWGRIPTKLPDGPRGAAWRRRLTNARRMRNWGEVESIHRLIRGWLLEHRP